MIQLNCASTTCFNTWSSITWCRYSKGSFNHLLIYSFKHFWVILSFWQLWLKLLLIFVFRLFHKGTFSFFTTNAQEYDSIHGASAFILKSTTKLFYRGWPLYISTSKETIAPICLRSAAFDGVIICFLFWSFWWLCSDIVVLTWISVPKSGLNIVACLYAICISCFAKWPSHLWLLSTCSFSNL